ncbi:hypothetical protein ACHHYP_04327 [Achlya hypogyna]|uniref:Transmembrane protein n=1 Tax=Achlya hypogyna TaxID=1202772 RepID=A0A1V9ZP93_ACHHY|nr:hypothetical protein ACHHYP_04327 [Achlya hypogyna]
MPKVAVARPPSSLGPPYIVRRDRTSHAIRFLFVLNLLSMPMKAYLSEYVPWSQPPVTTPTYTNFTAFNASTLELSQTLYSRRSLPQGSTYYYDDTQNTHVFRTVIARPSPVAASDCVQDFLPGIVGVYYMTTATLAALCDCAAAPNISSCDKRGSCYVDRMITQFSGHSCAWATTGDDVEGTDPAGVVTVTHAYTAALLLPQWRWLKFIYRILMTCVVAYRLHVQYNVHVAALEKTLRIHGHRRDLVGKWRYTLVIGDPTVLVLTNPAIGLGFVLDVWLSTDNVGVATLRTSQTSDLWLTVRTILYLSRIVWFAYAALSLTNELLKKHKKEHLFAAVDPTIVAVTIAIYCFALSWMAQYIPVLISAFSVIYNCLVPADVKGEEIELILGCSIFTATMTVVPINYGIARAFVDRLKQTPDRSLTQYQMRSFTNAKNWVL